MNTKLRISIWIVALFLVFSGVGLSSRQAFAASGLYPLRSVNIFIYSGHALVSVYSALPAKGVADVLDARGQAVTDFLANRLSIGIASASLSAADVLDTRGQAVIDFLANRLSIGIASTSLGAADVLDTRGQAVTDFLANRLSIGIASTSLSAADVLDARGQAVADSLAVLSSSSKDLTTLNANDAMAYRYSAMAKFYATHPSTSVGLTTLSASSVSGYSRHFMDYTVLADLNARVNSVDEQRLDDAHSLQAMSHFADHTYPWNRSIIGLRR